MTLRNPEVQRRLHPLSGSAATLSPGHVTVFAFNVILRGCSELQTLSDDVQMPSFSPRTAVTTDEHVLFLQYRVPNTDDLPL